MPRFLILVLLPFLVVPLVAMPPDEQMYFADGLYARGLYDLALDEYLKLSREDETFDRMDLVLYRIGECHRRLDNPGAAERFYLRVLREHPDSTSAPRAEFRRAEGFVTLGRYLDAINLFRAFLEKEPPEPLAAPAHYYKGYAAKRQLLTEEAEQDFQTVLEQYPDSPFASYAALDLAELYAVRPDRATEVLPLYERAAANPATPDVAAEALFQQGEWFFRAADYAESAERYGRLLNRYPDARRAHEAQWQAAWAYHNAGRYADGLALAETALADPAHEARYAEWLYLRANCQRQLVRTEDARATYARLLDEYPHHTLAQVASYEVALIAFRQDRFDEALADAEAIEPDEAIREDVYWLLAESYAGVGRDDEAVQYYRLLLDTYPDSDRVPKALYRLGRLLQNRRDYVSAARTFRELAERFPDDALAPEGLFAAAFCMAMEDRHEAAVKDWATLLTRYPGHALAAEARYQQALAEMQLGRDRQARTAFDEFLEHHGDSALAVDAHYWLSVLQERAGNHAAAEHALRAVLALEPSAELSVRARFRLAVALQRQEKADEAADLMQDLLDTAARGTLPLSMMEWLALYRLDASEYESAAAAAQAMTEAADTPAWRQIGWALYGRSLQGQGKPDKAVSAFERSLAEDARTRDGAEAAWHLGRLKLDAGESAGAVPYLERAAELAASDELADIRARAYFGLGRAAEMAEDWDRAARMYLSVGILFDDPEITPESLYRAAIALGHAGRESERARTAQELQERYPKWSEE